jgi:hypothetical protein
MTLAGATSLEAAREILVCKHREALDRVHELVVARGVTNPAYRELAEARQSEIGACQDVCNVNDVIRSVERYHQNLATAAGITK